MIIRFTKKNDQPVLGISPGGLYKFWDTQSDCAMSFESIDCSSERVRKYLEGEVKPRGMYADWFFVSVTDVEINGDELRINDLLFRRCDPATKDLTIRRVTRLREQITKEFKNIYYRRVAE